MTHDLMRDLIVGLDAQVTKIVVTDLKNSTFYAVIHLSMNGSQVVVDSRPSDAIALALRSNAPIYVSAEVVNKARSIDVSQENEEEMATMNSTMAVLVEDFAKRAGRSLYVSSL